MEKKLVYFTKFIEKLSLNSRIKFIINIYINSTYGYKKITSMFKNSRISHKAIMKHIHTNKSKIIELLKVEGFFENFKSDANFAIKFENDFERYSIDFWERIVFEYNF